MEQTIKVQPTTTEVLKASSKASGPADLSCTAQVGHNHPLMNSELNYNQHRHNLSMQMLRNRDGLHAPLKIGMELHAARQVGRLPFLASSNVQMDVLLGKDELIEFSDFLAAEDNCEYMRQPHAVVEKSIGIF